MKIGNVGRYLGAVVREFSRECDEGFPNAFDAKRKLWKSAVIVWEIDPEPTARIEQLRETALDYGLRATDVSTTIESARRKAASHA